MKRVLLIFLVLAVILSGAFFLLLPRWVTAETIEGALVRNMEALTRTSIRAESFEVTYFPRLAGTWQKIYKHYSGYPGGLKTYTLAELREKNPTEIIKRAISRMLPKNKLGREMLRRLRVYAGPVHKQQAQKPTPLEC